MGKEKDKYRLLVENLPDAFAYHQLVVDENNNPVDYIFIEVNPFFEEITGLKKEDILGKKITEVLPHLKFSDFDWIGAYGKVALTGKSIHFEAFSVPLGRRYEVIAFSDEKGYFITVFKDVNELKIENEKTKKIIGYVYKCQEFSADTLDYHFFTDTIMELSGAKFVILNLISEKDKSKTVTQAVSGATGNLSWITELLGFDLEGAVWEAAYEELGVGSKNRLVYYPSFSDIGYYNNSALIPVLKKIEKSLLPGGLYAMEINYLGEPFGIVALIIPKNQDLENKELLELYINYLASTIKRLRAEKSLRKSEERYRALVDNINEAIIVAQEGVIKYVNSKATELSGYSKEEMLFSSITDYIHPDDRDMVLTKHRRRLEGEEFEARYQFRIVKNNGDIRWVEISAVSTEWDNQLATLNLLLDITERKNAEEKIRFLSYYDQLTGLYNRTFMEVELHQLDNKQQLPISIIMADLNGLKLANETYGDAVGDEMLKCTAGIIKNSSREEDIIARWGGDEFVIILPQTKEKEAEAIINKITEIYHETYIKGIPLSITAGAATKNRTGIALAEIIKEAENDMYKKKLVEKQSEKSRLLEGFMKTLAEKSFETEAHVQNMQRVAIKIGEKLGLPESELNRLKLLIMLHDMGKTNIPGEILTKEGSLSPEEWRLVKQHPETGYRIARAAEEFAHVAEDILAHHERWDGTGYPNGLKEKEIPLLARITAVADAHEVMTNGRPYKKPMSKEEIVKEFKRCAGKQFDPGLVEIFLSVLETEI
ncbi:MAG: PAS domain S-box protein [Bacillota bacterium]